MHLTDRRDVRALLDRSRSLNAAELTNLALCAPKELAAERSALTRSLRRDPFTATTEVELLGGKTAEEWLAIAERVSASRKPPEPVS